MEEIAIKLERLGDEMIMFNTGPIEDPNGKIEVKTPAKAQKEAGALLIAD